MKRPMMIEGRPLMRSSAGRITRRRPAIRELGQVEGGQDAERHRDRGRGVTITACRRSPGRFLPGADRFGFVVRKSRLSALAPRVTTV